MRIPYMNNLKFGRSKKLIMLLNTICFVMFNPLYLNNLPHTITVCLLLTQLMPIPSESLYGKPSFSQTLLSSNTGLIWRQTDKLEIYTHIFNLCFDCPCLFYYFLCCWNKVAFFKLNAHWILVVQCDFKLILIEVKLI